MRTEKSRFYPIFFRPVASRYARNYIYGLNLITTDSFSGFGPPLPFSNFYFLFFLFVSHLGVRKGVLKGNLKGAAAKGGLKGCLKDALKGVLKSSLKGG